MKESYESFTKHFKPILEEKRFHPRSIFASKFYLLWVCQWDLKHVTSEVVTITRSFHVKWCSSFIISKTILKLVIEEWLTKREYRETKVEELQQTLFFLAQRVHTNTFISQAKTQEKILEIIKQLSHGSPRQTSCKKGDLDETQLPNGSIFTSLPVFNASSANLIDLEAFNEDILL